MAQARESLMKHIHRHVPRVPFPMPDIDHHDTPTTYGQVYGVARLYIATWLHEQVGSIKGNTAQMHGQRPSNQCIVAER